MWKPVFPRYSTIVRQWKFAHAPWKSVGCYSDRSSPWLLCSAVICRACSANGWCWYFAVLVSRQGRSKILPAVLQVCLILACEESETWTHDFAELYCKYVFTSHNCHICKCFEVDWWGTFFFLITLWNIDFCGGCLSCPMPCQTGCSCHWAHTSIRTVSIKKGFVCALKSAQRVNNLCILLVHLCCSDQSE